MLAWLRTGLALVTFGYVLARVDAWLHGIAPPDVLIHRSAATAWIGAGFIVLGVLANGMAVLRYLRIRRVLRRGGELPVDVFPAAFSAIVTLLGAVLAIYVISRLA